MNPKRPIRDLERQLRREPDNLALRLTLAAAYREADRAVEALALYRSVARAYAEQGRASQAAAVCRSALELAPEDGELYGMLVHLERTSTTRPPPLGPAPAIVAPPATTPPPSRTDNPMQSTVKRVPPPPPPPPRAPSVPERATPLPRLSSSDLETPLPPPMALHETRDSIVEMPHLREDPDTVIPLTVKRTPLTPVSAVAQASASQSGERPSSADFAAEMVTRRRPKLSPRDLDLLDTSSLDGLATDPVQVALPEVGSSEGGHDDPAMDPALDDDEPTTPPAPSPSPTLPRLRTADDFADRGTVEFAGERPFEATLAQLGPDGSTLEGPLGVFAMLPAEAATELARRAVVKSYDPDEIVIREGDMGDACYVIVAGEVAVRKRLADGEVIELARLSDGSLFGEFALLADRRRHATVAAVTECEIYEIPRLLLRELAAAFPEVGPALETFYRERLVSNLLITTPLFETVPADQRAAILARFHPMHIDSGQAVIRQGERAGGLYLVVLGAVEVVRDQGDRRATLLASLGEGAYFGEMSLLSGDAASASVIAHGPCELAVLPPRDFYDIVSHNPALWSAMRGEAEARRLANARILTGRTGVV